MVRRPCIAAAFGAIRRIARDREAIGIGEVVRLAVRFGNQADGAKAT